MKYEKPRVSDLGSIAEHTWLLPPDFDHEKGGGPIWHLDKWCEMSGCTSANDPECVDLCGEGPPGNNSTGTSGTYGG